ncbi:MAG: hypothetical protein ABW048_14475 [Sphingobium sp.]
MPLNDIIAGFATALEETRQKLRDVDAQLEQANIEKNSIIQAPPHTDDIVAAFKRGLKRAEESFVSRLAWYVTGNDGDFAAQTERAEAQLLMVGPHKPERAQSFPWVGLAERQKDIDVAAVTYFLRDIIAAELPALVNRLRPYAHQGMKQLDRKAAMRTVEAKIAALQKERERLIEEIEAARKAVIPKSH